MTSNSQRLDKGSILIIDDTLENLQVLSATLSQGGYTVRGVIAGSIAVMVARLAPPDLILLDIQMPEIDGYEVCLQLKADDITRDIPVIFISILDDVIDKAKAFKVGGVDYITKPFQVEEILARVKNQLTIQRLSRQLKEQNPQLQKSALQQQLERSNLIREISEKIRSELDTQKIFETSAIQIGQALGVSRTLIHTYTSKPTPKIPLLGEFLAPGASTLMNFDIPIIANPHLQRLLSQDKAIASNDVYAEPLLQNAQGICRQFEIKSMLAVRTSYKGEANGVIAVHQCDRQRLWTAADIELIESIAGQLGIALAQAKLLEQEKLARAELDRQNLLLQQEIHERLYTEAALKNSESKYRRLVETSQDIIWSVDISGQITFVNPAVKHIYGYEPEEMIGRPFTDFVPRSQVARDQEVLRRIFQGESVFGHETIYLAQDGSPVYLMFNGIPLRDVSGIVGATGTANNITEPKRAQAARRASETKLASAFRSSPEPIGLCTFPEIRYIEVNDSFCNFFGYSPEQVIGRTHKELNTLVNKLEYRILAQLLQQQGAIRNYEIDLRTTVGEIRTALFSAEMIEIDGQQYVLGTAKDITERKLAENESRLLLLTTQAISRAVDLDSALARVLRLICNTINWDFAEAWLPNDDGAILKYSHGWYGHDSSLEKFYRQSETVTYAIGMGLPGRVWLSRQPEWIQDVCDVPEGIFLRCQQAAQVGLKAGFGVPILADNQVLAVLVFFKRAKRAVDRRLLYLVSTVAAQLGWLIQRKQVEAAHRQSEKRLQLALEASDLGLWDWNLSSGKIYRDWRWKRMLGYEEHEIGDNQSAFEQLVHPEDLPTVTRALNDHLQDPSSVVEEEFRMRSKSGEWKWIQSRGQVVERDERGTPLRMTGTHKDISERKRAELALFESAERERAITQVIQRMRQTLDLETIFAATTQELRQVLNCDRVVAYRFNPDWSGEFVAESVGKGWISLIEEHKNHPNLMEGSVENERCVVQLLDSQHNHVLDTYLQETQGGVYSRGASFLCVPDIYKTGFDPCYINLLERFQARAYITVPIFCGSQLWGLLASYQNCVPRQWKTGEINIVVQIGNQLGVALQQAELLAQTQRQSQALQQAVIAADAANRAKSEFLTNMSHELRTPLNAILGFTQLMSRDNFLSTEHQQNLEIINRAGEHLLNLINDILEMSKIEAGRTSLNINSFDLIHLLDNLQEMLRFRAVSKGLELVFEYDPDMPQYVQTDASKLRQVLLNLLGNAIKFTNSGSVTLRVGMGSGEWGVACGESSTPYTLHFQITDTGSGIAPQEIDLLFKAFRQTETGRKSQQGTGLGLAICRKYIHLMGGEISVSSNVGVGSAFAFDIQIALASSCEIPSTPRQRQIIGLAPNQPKYRILVVDDAIESTLFLVKLLTSIGYEVREATNGVQAICMWESWQPHLIFMDMRMPVMDGYEATRQIKAKERGLVTGELGVTSGDQGQWGLENPNTQSPVPNPQSRTIIIALTASAFEEQKMVMIEAGCDDFINKPFPEKLLLEKISQYLGVQYLYEEESDRTQSERDKTPERILTNADLLLLLSQISPEWVTQVHHAAAQCSDELILNLLEQIPPENMQLAKVLMDLARNFQFEKIMELTSMVNNQ